jgi:hypothetical protein
MPFVVAECDPEEIPFFHHDRAFRSQDPLQTFTESVDSGLTLCDSDTFVADPEEARSVNNRQEQPIALQRNPMGSGSLRRGPHRDFRDRVIANPRSQAE